MRLQAQKHALEAAKQSAAEKDLALREMQRQLQTERERAEAEVRKKIARVSMLGRTLQIGLQFSKRSLN